MIFALLCLTCVSVISAEIVYAPNSLDLGSFDVYWVAVAISSEGIDDHRDSTQSCGEYSNIITMQVLIEKRTDLGFSHRYDCHSHHGDVRKPRARGPPALSIADGDLVASNSGVQNLSSDVLAAPGRLQKKMAAWRRYEGDLNLRAWSKKYDVLQRNRLRGRFNESFGPRGEIFDTPYGRRIVDNAPATEIKGGYATRTKFIRRQILKDSFLKRTVEGYDPVWRFRGRASKPLLRHLDTFGIPYEFVP